MDKQELENLQKAGRIAAEALHYAKGLLKPGASLLEVTEKTEDKIKKLGGELAFPVQISLNDVAAHFCPEADDKIIFKDQLVSIDIGVHINGFIGDNAVTVDLSGKHAALVKASRDALDNAIKIIKPGIAVSWIGKVIHDTIVAAGFAPVRNLSGHGLEKFNIHSTPTIPNYDNGDKTALKEGMVIAIEPFASAGAGVIYESSPATIFQLAKKRPVRNIFTREILKEIEQYKELPFCRRWLAKKFGLPKTNFAIRELLNLGIIREYPPLVDKEHGIVSQAEHTVLVEEKAVVLTRAE